MEITKDVNLDVSKDLKKKKDLEDLANEDKKITEYEKQSKISAEAYVSTNDPKSKALYGGLLTNEQLNKKYTTEEYQAKLNEIDSIDNKIAKKKIVETSVQATHNGASHWQEMGRTFAKFWHPWRMCWLRTPTIPRVKIGNKKLSFPASGKSRSCSRAARVTRDRRWWIVVGF